MKRAFISMVCFLVLWSLGPERGFAGEIKFPTYSYEAGELQKLRQWEKTWAGKKIATENVDQVKDFLHGGVYRVMKEPQNFGAESLWFTVVPYRPYNLSKGMIEATRKYAPESKIIDEDALAGYGEVAGIPFPQPKPALKWPGILTETPRETVIRRRLTGLLPTAAQIMKGVPVW